MADIYRRMGMPEQEVAAHEGVAQTLQEALEIARPRIAPRAVYHIMRIKETGPPVRFEDSEFTIGSLQVAKLLKGCAFAAIFMSTIGPELEKASLEASDSGDITLSFILDAVASETADAVANDFHRRVIKEMAEERGYSVTPRFSPGYGDWPITVQPAIHALCRGERIGIALTSTSLMIPRKSVSAVFGLKTSEPRF